MDHWTDGHISPLVKDICGAGNYRGAHIGAISKRDKKESVAMAYNR